MPRRVKSESTGRTPERNPSSGAIAAEFGFDSVQFCVFRGSDPLSIDASTSSNNDHMMAALSHAHPEALPALQSDGPVWKYLPNSPSTSKPDERKKARSKTAPGGECLLVPVRLTSQICIVWILSRSRSADKLGRATLEKLCGTLYLLSCEILANSGLQMLLSIPPLGITQREVEILNWFKRGKTYAEIGEILGISSKTVDYHLGKLMRKLNVYDKLSAILKAARIGLIDID